jgi:hypothetical protein
VGIAVKEIRQARNNALGISHFGSCRFIASSFHLVCDCPVFPLVAGCHGELDSTRTNGERAGEEEGGVREERRERREESGWRGAHALRSVVAAVA